MSILYKSIETKINIDQNIIIFLHDPIVIHYELILIFIDNIVDESYNIVYSEKYLNAPGRFNSGIYKISINDESCWKYILKKSKPKNKCVKICEDVEAINGVKLKNMMDKKILPPFYVQYCGGFCKKLDDFYYNFYLMKFEGYDMFDLFFDKLCAMNSNIKQKIFISLMMQIFIALYHLKLYGIKFYDSQSRNIIIKPINKNIQILNEKFCTIESKKYIVLNEGYIVKFIDLGAFAFDQNFDIDDGYNDFNRLFCLDNQPFNHKYLKNIFGLSYKKYILKKYESITHYFHRVFKEFKIL